MNGPRSASYPTGGAPAVRERTPDVVALDNLMRRQLRVSNPNDAQEVAQALGKLFPADQAALTREAAGLPFLVLPAPPAAALPVTSSGLEVEQASGDVERDLTALLTNSLLKDIQPELRGWASAIRHAVDDGFHAARYALDARQRDRAFGARRLLGSYARLARYVGALTPTLNPPYRALAQGLDEVAGVMLVLMGEALANVGFGGGRFLLQAPASELQERRDAAVFALRNLVGSAQEAYGPNDWPRGLVAYRGLVDRLQATGQSDLLSLLEETTLARMMDDLIDRAAASNADGLRALGATATPALESFRRLILIGQRVVSPEAPALASYLTALQLFLDPFGNDRAAIGYRLVYLGRPPVVFYGLYGIGGPDPATERLLQLAQHRGTLATLLDCYLGCDCSASRVRCQILLDKVLYDVDRAIDLYALGTDPEGEGPPEDRAAAYAFVIDALIEQAETLCCFHPQVPCGEQGLVHADIQGELETIRDVLWHDRTFTFDQTLTDVGGSDVNYTEMTNVPFENLGSGLHTIETEIVAHGEAVEIPAELRDLRRIVASMEQELCIQRDAQDQWENLLHTMAPSCFRFARVFTANGAPGVLVPVDDLIEAAIEDVTGEAAECPRFQVEIPPHFETSLDSIADDVDRIGNDRPSLEDLP